MTKQIRIQSITLKCRYTRHLNEDILWEEGKTEENKEFHKLSQIALRIKRNNPEVEYHQSHMAL